MKLRTVKRYTDRYGGRRDIRLYCAWKNLKARLRGTMLSRNGKSYWQGKDCMFRDWGHFREWSIANGYSRVNRSLDRIKSELGYGPDNCRWITVEENCSAAGDVTALNRSIMTFQQQPVTQEEEHELDEALGIVRCHWRLAFS